MRIASAVTLMALITVACSERPTVAAKQASAAAQPKWMTDETTATVAPSPQVQALLKEDPDIGDLSDDEIKAALAAAQASAPDEPLTGPRVAASGEWSELEQKQRKKLDAHRQKLASTIVEKGRDGSYHTGGCPSVWPDVYDQRTGRVQRVKTSTPVTLAGAVDQRLGRHAECGVPDATYSYN